MSESEFIAILIKAKQALNSNGRLIIRKLLGNYYLYGLLSQLGFTVDEYIDDGLENSIYAKSSVQHSINSNIKLNIFIVGA